VGNCTEEAKSAIYDCLVSFEVHITCDQTIGLRENKISRTFRGYIKISAGNVAVGWGHHVAHASRSRGVDRVSSYVCDCVRLFVCPHSKRKTARVIDAKVGTVVEHRR